MKLSSNSVSTELRAIKLFIFAAAISAITALAFSMSQKQKPFEVSTAPTADAPFIADLNDIRSEYSTAEPSERSLLRLLVVRHYEVYKNQLPSNLRDFYAEMERGSDK